MRQPERRATTRNTLCEAFWQRYERHGLRGITVTLLCADTGLHRSTFYEYFDSIPDLLAREEEQLMNEIIEALAELLSRAEEAELSFELVDTVLSRRIRQVTALLGPHGDPAFTSALRTAALPVVCASLGLAEDDETTFILDMTMTAVLTFLVNSQMEHPGLLDASRLRLARSILHSGVVAQLLDRSATPERVRAAFGMTSAAQR